ncbi:MAG: ATP-binding protein [Thermoguttaceae bacterium]
MLAGRPIRFKLLIGFGLLVLVVGILSGSGLYATYAYRSLVKSLRSRVRELPLAAQLSRDVADLRITLSELRGLRTVTFDPSHSGPTLRVRVREDFRSKFTEVGDTLDDYRRCLRSETPSSADMADTCSEWVTVCKIEESLGRIERANQNEDWVFDTLDVDGLDTELAALQDLTAELPSHLHGRLRGFASEVRGKYRTLIVGTWITTFLAALIIFALFVRLSWQWILRPLRVIIHGSRKVAAGQFGHRIHVDGQDEMAELADAFNAMTDRFETIRDDLDAQVRQRTKQAVRSEQLASVGFLAAGVAHEINNPLASIAMCAESLQGRIEEMLHAADTSDTGPSEVVDRYLQMIQDEAFRCKEITEKLLDFSRVGPTERRATDLAQLVRDVVDMIGHLGRYQGKSVEFAHEQPLIVPVNAQEIKQVVLNLLTNAMDSSHDEGVVTVRLHTDNGMARLTFDDAGCGMDPDVLAQVFEPFFTRRRAGQGVGQGTGLGLSISSRIITDHGGTLEAESPGAGRGSTFTIRLPLMETNEEIESRHHAA